MQKTVDTRRRSESMQQSSTTQSLYLGFWGLRKIVAFSHSSLQCHLVSRVFGMVLVIITSIKIIKNEVGCRDDTMPKTGDTRRHCEVELTVCNNLPQPPKKRDVGKGVAEDCYILLTLPTVPSCVTCFWHGVIPTSYFIFILV